VLEPALADQIERFIATFRQALTDTVSPVVQNPSRTSAQVAQMRQGLTTIIAALPPLRREIESAYREISAGRPRDDDDDEDEFDA
jgi:predicted HAD superfamily phosphohydrolase YqeG